MGVHVNEGVVKTVAYVWYGVVRTIGMCQSIGVGKELGAAILFDVLVVAATL